MNSNLDASNLTEIKTEELIKRNDIYGTPFTIVTQGNESFVSLGIYRVSDKMAYHDALDLILDKDWNLILNCLTSVLDAAEKMKQNENKLKLTENE